MKKIAVICLLVSLAFPSGAVPAFAQTPGNEVTVVQGTDTAGNQASQQKEVQNEPQVQNATESQDVSAYDYPADWDPEDPQNARAYEQLMGIGEETDAPVLFDAGSRAAASQITTQWNGKTYTHNDFNTRDCDVVPCIDVSYHQGTINWTKVKNAGIDYVILRVGYRASASGTLNNDKMFETYIKDAQKAGLKVGVYIYSQAISVKEAEEEAEFTLNRIKNYTIDLPVTFDYEYYGAEEGRLYNAHLSKSEKTKCAEAFCKKVTAAGYQAMVYANASFCESELDTAALHEKYQIWMARYNSYSYNESRDKGIRYGGQIDFWQCSESAKVDGIDSNTVDFNWWYKSRDTQAGDGVVYDSSMGTWVYQVNGKIDSDYTGLATNENGTWWIEKGVVDFNCNDIKASGKDLYYIRGGKVDTSYTGLASNANGWWYVKNGKVDFTYTDFVKYDGHWWYVKDGSLTFKERGLFWGTVDGETTWWSVGASQLDLSETIVYNQYGWWYTKNGKVDNAYTGLASNENGWWYVKNGKVDFSYYGFAKNSYGWWYVEAGHISMDKDTIVPGAVGGVNGWWHIKDSKVVYDTTIDCNENGWWYIKDGKVDFDYNGLASNSNGWWYVDNGQVTFQTDNIVSGTVNGKDGWWHVKDSQVVYDTTVDYNENGWWYVKDGKVDFTYNGFASNSNGWWYVNNGQVTFQTNSIISGSVKGKEGWWHVKDSQVVYDTTVDCNENGWWYVKDGKVDFTYTGLAANAMGYWYLKNGQVDFSYTGIARNENGRWYVKDGKIDFSYNGTVKFDNTVYTIKGGKVESQSTGK